MNKKIPQFQNLINRFGTYTIKIITVLHYYKLT